MSANLLHEISAALLSSRYGNEAAAEAARRAEVSQAQGDLPGRDKWLLVGETVHAMKSDEAGLSAE